MFKDNKILMGKSNEKECSILLNKANRHGLITGASGSGKTISLKVMAESFSSAGVPVFLADIKGDLAATCMPGEMNDNIQKRIDNMQITDFNFKGFPCIFWDVFGRDGHPIRTTLQTIGATILSRMLGLNQTQEGVLSVIFKIAKENGYDLIDLKDLKMLLQYVAENSKEYTLNYGNIASQSVGTIQRSLSMLEEQGGDYFFGEPAIDINDFFKCNSNGLGNINILHAVELYKKPKLYACFLLWILSALNSELPEVGDLEKPKMIFFFDEAHLLFDDLPDYIEEQVIQIVKLIRSKGVGIYFISQSPSDIPGEILAQLGNRIQHNLRAYTPAEQKIVKAVATSYRANPEFDTEEAILNLGTGEAVVSFINELGEPGICEKVTILPPQSQMGALDDSMRLMVISRSEFKGKYDTLVDNVSAYEILSEEIEKARLAKEEEKAAKEEEKRLKEEEKELRAKEREEARIRREEERQADRQRREEDRLKREAERARKNSIPYKFGTKVASSAMSSVGRQIGNGLFKAGDQIIKSLFK